MAEGTQIQCPQCGAIIDVNQLLYKKLDAEIGAKYQSQIKEAEERNKKNAHYLREEHEKLKEQQAQLQDEIANKVREKVSLERKQLMENLRKDIDAEKAEEVEIYKKQLDDKNLQLRDLHKTKAELEIAKREKDEVEIKVRAETEKIISEKIKAERERLQLEVSEQMQQRMTEKDNKLHEGQLQIDQMRKKIEELQRKAEQGSMQLQGEVQELAIEEFLKAVFPFDEIREVPKGISGADCMQVVRNSFGQECGIILYESKRTKAFANEWIEKFKNDMRSTKASIGILVTKTLPRDMDRMGQREGVWICTFEEFKSLSMVLREQILKVYDALSSQENKEDKMTHLYSYLTGEEFRSIVEAIVEGFSQMQTDLQKERIAMEKLWAQREKQLQKVLKSTVNMYGSIKGIAGNAIGTVQALELPSDEQTLF